MLTEKNKNITVCNRDAVFVFFGADCLFPLSGNALAITFFAKRGVEVIYRAEVQTEYDHIF